MAASPKEEFDNLNEIRESNEPVIISGARFETTQKQHARVASQNVARPKSFKFVDSPPVFKPLTDEEVA